MALVTDHVKLYWRSDASASVPRQVKVPTVYKSSLYKINQSARNQIITSNKLYHVIITSWFSYLYRKPRCPSIFITFDFNLCPLQT
jgi:hypothetical protein